MKSKQDKPLTECPHCLNSSLKTDHVNPTDPIRTYSDSLIKNKNALDFDKKVLDRKVNRKPKPCNLFREEDIKEDDQESKILDVGEINCQPATVRQQRANEEQVQQRPD
jgi:hypothetical protein